MSETILKTSAPSVAMALLLRALFQAASLNCTWDVGIRRTCLDAPRHCSTKRDTKVERRITRIYLQAQCLVPGRAALIQPGITMEPGCTERFIYGGSLRQALELLPQ